MDGLKEILEKEWVGKRFVYISPKYGGETFGEIESVRVGIEMRFDGDSESMIKDIVVEYSKNQPNMRVLHEMSAINNHEKENGFKWIGTRPNISIFSTKGQMYELNEIYILNDEIDEK